MASGPTPFPSQAESLVLLYDRLVNDTALLALVPAAQITNHRVQDGVFPACILRVDGGVPFNTKDSNGYTQRFVFDSWTAEHGDEPALAINDAVVAALHDIPFAVASSGQSLLLQFESFQMVPTDGVSHHGITFFTHIFTN